MFQVIRNPIGDADESRVRNWLKAEGAIIARRVVLDKITVIESEACEAQLKAMQGFEGHRLKAEGLWKQIAALQCFLATLNELSQQSEPFASVTLQKT